MGCYLTRLHLQSVGLAGRALVILGRSPTFTHFQTPSLTFIDAKNCDLNECVIPILGRSLRMGCYLTRLHLQSVGQAGRAFVILGRSPTFGIEYGEFDI